jgi:hypothetical protein
MRIYQYAKDLSARLGLEITNDFILQHLPGAGVLDKKTSASSISEQDREKFENYLATLNQTGETTQAAGSVIEAEPKDEKSDGDVSLETIDAATGVPEDGFTMDQIAQLMTERLGEPVSVGEVLDACAFFGNEKTRTRMELDEIEVALREQRQAPGDEQSLGALLAQYRAKGHIGLTVGRLKAMLRDAVPGLSSMKFDTPVDDAIRAEIAKTINTTLAICVQADRDAVARQPENWPLTDLNYADKDKPGDRRLVRYTAACGHVAYMDRRTMEYRLSNTNSRVGSFFSLCVECLHRRIRLMDRIPGVASPASVCQRCGESVFGRVPDKFRTRKSDDELALIREGGFTSSRRELWDNLTRNVLTVVMLPGRLVPAHRSTDERCLDVQAERRRADKLASFQACDEAIDILILGIAQAVAQNPDIKVQLMAKRPEKIAEIRRRFGLPEDDEGYYKLRRRLGLTDKETKR